MSCHAGIVILLVAAGLWSRAAAQGLADSAAVRRSQPVPDTVPTPRGAPAERVIAGRADTLSPSYHPRRSTGIAMGLSAILPGAGQIYNGSYWKAPIVMGLGVYFVSSWLDNNRRYLDYARQYAASISSSSGADQTLLSAREFYRDQRDTFTWYFFVLYLANIADAYVDASLYDFNVGGDLSIRMMPIRSAMPDGSPQVQLRITF